MEHLGLGIGVQYSRSFARALENVEAGQILVFGNDCAFLCRRNMDSILSLKRISYATEMPSVLEYKYSDIFSLDLTDSIGMQHFYEQVRDDYNDDVRLRVITMTEPYEQTKIELGWLEASPVVMEFVRNVSRTEKTEFLDNNARKAIDFLLATKEYALAYALIDVYCRQNSNS